MTRPGVVVVCATGTGVGKTWFTCALAAEARRRGLRVAARKPVQSYDPADTEPPDAVRIAAATGEPVEVVCPPHRGYPVPLAPPMATDVLGLPAVHLADLLAELRWPQEPADLHVVETVGGLRSPLADDADSAALAHALSPAVAVVVADAGLGTINAVRLAVAALEPLPVIVFVNRYDPDTDLHARNVAWLAGRDGLPVHTGVAATLDALLASPAR